MTDPGVKQLSEPDMREAKLLRGTSTFKLVNSSFSAFSVSTAKFNSFKSRRNLYAFNHKDDCTNDAISEKKISALQSELDELRIKHLEDAAAHKSEIARLARKIHERDVRLELASAVAADAAALRLEVSRLQHEIHKRDLDLEYASLLLGNCDQPKQRHSIKNVDVIREEDDNDDDGDVCPEKTESCSSLDGTVRTEISSIATSSYENKDYNKLVEALKKEIALAEEERCKSEVDMATELCRLEDNHRKEILEYQTKLEEKTDIIHRLEETSKERENELSSMCRQYASQLETNSKEQDERETKLQDALREESERNVELEEAVVVHKEQVVQIKKLCQDIVQSYQEELDEVLEERSQLEIDLANKLVMMGDQKRKMEREYEKQIEGQRQLLRLLVNDNVGFDGRSGEFPRNPSSHNAIATQWLRSSAASAPPDIPFSLGESSSHSSSTVSNTETTSLHGGGTHNKQLQRESIQLTRERSQQRPAPLFQWYVTSDESPLLCTVSS